MDTLAMRAHWALEARAVPAAATMATVVPAVTRTGALVVVAAAAIMVVAVAAGAAPLTKPLVVRPAAAEAADHHMLSLVPPKYTSGETGKWQTATAQSYSVGSN